MMNFIMLTLCITVAILLASFIACLLMLNKPVMKWYMRYVTKLSEELVEEAFNDQEAEDL